MDSKVCSIYFQMKVETPVTDIVFISGNIPELGNWDPYNSIKLESNDVSYPIWSSSKPLTIVEGYQI